MGVNLNTYGTYSTYNTYIFLRLCNTLIAITWRARTL